MIIVTDLQFNYRKTEKILSAIITPQIDQIPAFSSTDIIHWAADFFSSATFVMFEQVRKNGMLNICCLCFYFFNILLILFIFWLLQVYPNDPFGIKM